MATKCETCGDWHSDAVDHCNTKAMKADRAVVRALVDVWIKCDGCSSNGKDVAAMYELTEYQDAALCDECYDPRYTPFHTERPDAPAKRALRKRMESW